MRSLLLGCFVLVAACSPLTPPGFDAGEEDAGSPDANEVVPVRDAGLCDGGFCPPERITAELIDPLDLAVDGTNVYWLEYGLETGGTSGQVMKQRKGTTCLKRDAGCAVDLNMDVLGRFRLDSLTLANGELCWVEAYANARDVMCQSVTTNRFRVVARNQPYATRPTWANGALYWVNQGTSPINRDGAVMRILSDAPAGTPPTPVAQGRANPGSVAVAGDLVLWTERGFTVDGGAVTAVSLDGGGVTAIATRLPRPLSVIACDGGVYWADYNEGSIMHATLAPNSGGLLVGGQRGPFQVLCDATHLYWLNTGTNANGADGELWQSRLDGTEATPMVQGIPAAWALAQDDTYVYWIAQGTVTRIEGTIWRMRKHP